MFGLVVHYHNCVGYLDCRENACYSTEKTIRHMIDTKKIDPRDPVILQT